MFAPTPQAPSDRGNQHLVLYDGVCGLCNRLNGFLLPRDRDGVFAFASLQSATGRSLLSQFGKDAAGLSTFYVVTNYRSDSTALLSKSRVRRAPRPAGTAVGLRLRPDRAQPLSVVWPIRDVSAAGA